MSWSWSYRTGKVPSGKVYRLEDFMKKAIQNKNLTTPVEYLDFLDSLEVDTPAPDTSKPDQGPLQQPLKPSTSSENIKETQPPKKVTEKSKKPLPKAKKEVVEEPEEMESSVSASESEDSRSPSKRKKEVDGILDCHGLSGSYWDNSNLSGSRRRSARNSTRISVADMGLKKRKRGQGRSESPPGNENSKKSSFEKEKGEIVRKKEPEETQGPPPKRRGVSRSTLAASSQVLGHTLRPKLQVINKARRNRREIAGKSTPVQTPPKSTSKTKQTLQKIPDLSNKGTCNGVKTKRKLEEEEEDSSSPSPLKMQLRKKVKLSQTRAKDSSSSEIQSLPNSPKDKDHEDPEPDLGRMTTRRKKHSVDSIGTPKAAITSELSVPRETRPISFRNGIRGSMVSGDYKEILDFPVQKKIIKKKEPEMTQNDRIFNEVHDRPFAVKKKMHFIEKQIKREIAEGKRPPQVKEEDVPIPFDPISVQVEDSPFEIMDPEEEIPPAPSPSDFPPLEEPVPCLMADAECRLGCVCRSITFPGGSKGHCSKARCIFGCVCVTVEETKEEKDIRARLRSRVACKDLGKVSCEGGSDYRKRRMFPKKEHPKRKRTIVPPKHFGDFVLKKKVDAKVKKLIQGKGLSNGPKSSPDIKVSIPKSLQRKLGSQGAPAREQGKSDVEKKKSKREEDLNNLKGSIFSENATSETLQFQRIALQNASMDLFHVLDGLGERVCFLGWNLSQESVPYVESRPGLVNGQDHVLVLPIPSIEAQWLLFQLDEDYKEKSFIVLPMLRAIFDTDDLSEAFTCTNAYSTTISSKLVNFPPEFGKLYILPHLDRVMVIGPVQKEFLRKGSTMDGLMDSTYLGGRFLAISEAVTKEEEESEGDEGSLLRDPYPEVDEVEDSDVQEIIFMEGTSEGDFVDAAPSPLLDFIKSNLKLSV